MKITFASLCAQKIMIMNIRSFTEMHNFIKVIITELTIKYSKKYITEAELQYTSRTMTIY